MKIGTREFKNPHEETEVFPREGGPVVFKARAVLDYTAFNQLCPPPIPPFLKRPGQAAIKNISDPKYTLALQEYAEKKSSWMILESLKATPDLVWDTIKFDDSSTWKNWSKELEEAKFSQGEIQLILRAISRANSLDEAYLEEARKSFFLSQVQQQSEQSFQKEDQTSTPSGEPVNVSA